MHDCADLDVSVRGEWACIYPIMHDAGARRPPDRLQAGAGQHAAAAGLPGSTTAQRASFATKSLWVTPYDEEQMFPGGRYPLQNIYTGGLAEWTKEVRGSGLCCVLLLTRDSFA